MIPQQYLALAVLFLINTLNFMDRYSIPSVVKHIENYYHIKHTESGMLSSYFLVGFMLTAPLFGFLGDRYQRIWIIVGGVLFWSLAAFSASLIGEDYKNLFYLTRVLVGVGEASYSTIAPTIIADLFTPERRKFALSVFYFAIPIGSGLGYEVGTLALALGDWRWIFLITPLVGLVATGILIFIDEPVRGQKEGASSSEREQSSLIENVLYLLRIKSYMWANVGYTCCLFGMGALAWCGVTFMEVACGKGSEEMVRGIFGGVVCGAGFVGVVVGSGAAQYFKRFDGRADPIVCAIGIFVAIPLIFIALLIARSLTILCWVVLFLAVTALCTNMAVMSDMVLSVTLPNKRAFATAFQILISHLLGDALSPTIIGGLRDYLEKNTHDEYRAYQYALVAPLVVLIVGAAAFLYSSKFYAQDVEKNKLALGKNVTNEEQLCSEAADLTNLAAISA